MLTRKQTWRRQSGRINRGSVHDFIYQDFEEGYTYGAHKLRTQSEPILPVSTQPFQAELYNRKHLKSDTDVCGLMSPTQKHSNVRANSNKKKSVAYSRTVHVVLIPTRMEYQNAKLWGDIWWETDDYNSFKLSAIDELAEIMQLLNTDGVTARQLLYQPEHTKMIDAAMAQEPTSVANMKMIGHKKQNEICVNVSQEVA